MKDNVHISPQAVSDLDHIWEYIAVGLDNQSAATRTVDGILDRVLLLGDFPEMGTQLYRYIGIGGEYRFLICGNYYAFYRCEGVDVYIDRILYKRREYLHLLFDGQSVE